MEPDEKSVFVITCENERQCSIVGEEMELDQDRNLVILDSDTNTVAVFAEGFWKMVRKNEVITDGA